VRAISVGRRLSFLVATEVATALALLALGFASQQSLASLSQFMHRFVLVPIQQISAALDDVGRLGRNPHDPGYDQRIVGELDAFARYYGTEIKVAGNSGPDAQRQTAELRKLGRLKLIDREAQVFGSLEGNLGRISRSAGGTGVAEADVEALRSDLRDLLRINLEFVDAAQDDISMTAARTRTVLVIVGLAGILLAGALGLRVRSAIAPRIASLVQKIEKFREFGVNERAQVQGDDDITVLANALDIGFAAIVERNRERERFLAVAAHELKTPMVSILGFTRAALANPAQQGRALEVIQRQTRRLGYLVEELLWTAKARAGQLPFQPVPLDLVDVCRRQAEEVGETVPSHPISVHTPPSAHLLADEALLRHALSSLLIYAGLLSATKQPIELAIESSGARVLVRVKIHGSSVPAEDQVRIFEPFSTVQFEVDARPRSAMGLFLCREIARLHAGSIRVSEQAGVGPVLTMDLPA
jgi:signal transduction histidine kinase